MKQVGVERLSIDQRLAALWSIINLCEAGSCLLNGPLVSSEDAPAMQGLNGVMAAIKSAAELVANDVEVEW